MSDELQSGRPDAVFVLESVKKGNRSADRIQSILDIAEPILQVDRSTGEMGYVRKQADGWCFVTRDPADTIWGAKTTSLEGKPRYKWTVQSPSVKVGVLIDYLELDSD